MFIYIVLHICVFACNVFVYQEFTIWTFVMLETCYFNFYHVLCWPCAYFLVDQNHQIHTHNTLKIHFPIIHIPDHSIFMMRWWILNNPMPFFLPHNIYLLRYCNFSIFADLNFSTAWHLAWRYYCMEKKTWSTKDENKHI